MNDSVTTLTTDTIRDFGAQWTRFTENTGYYGSVELLSDILAGVVEIDELKGKHVAEIGSGTGRIVNMLLAAGAQRVTALEPSDAFDVLKKNTVEVANRIDYIRAPGEALPAGANLDFVFSIGVLHHIPDPRGSVRAAYNALKPGGDLVVWLYGHEGNEFYLAISSLLRKISTRMPDSSLEAMAAFLDYMLDPYIFLCRFIPLPMRKYFLGHYGKLSRENRRLTVFDQLNPSYAKYYKRQEALDLLANAGFEDLKLHHRHGYSWSVRGRKPAA